MRTQSAILAGYLLAGCFAAGCMGRIEAPSEEVPAPGDPRRDGGVRDGGVATTPPGRDGGIDADCDEVTPAATVFATSCASNGACHVPGAQYPDLTFDALSQLVGAPSRGAPGETLVVANAPAESWLYKKITGMQGPNGGFLMPIGTAEPIEGVSIIEDWIDDGAPTRCETNPPDLEVPSDPNALDQATLFTCAAPSTSSPARIRRVERSQWTHSAGYNLGSSANANPFYAPEGDYSTYAEDASIDATTLDLYMTILPAAATIWSARSSGVRLYSVYSDGTLRCMFNDAVPADDCIDDYVDRLLTRGVLFRTPTDDERSRVRAFLVAQLATEGGDPSNRQATLQQVGAAAWMMSGALFRPDLGEPVADDPEGRRRLTDDELALALGDVLSTHPPGSSMTQSADRRPGPPDADAPQDGWLGRIRNAALDGTIQDEAVLRELMSTYRGGVDATRADLALDVDGRDLPRRGEFWLAPKIRGFFREWLDYSSANSAFKDTPAATSGYEGEGTVNNSFGNLQHGYYGYESTFVAQMDDTIARAVLESESNAEDVFSKLLTTRTWRLPSNLSMSNDVQCTSSADCTVGGNTRCQSVVGRCSSSSSNNVVSAHRVYGVGDVPATPEGRWVQMPADERAGVLTHPAWLIAHGANFEDDASAVLRGKWIRENLLCQSVPGLELVMVEAQLVPSDPSLRARDRIRVSIEEGEAADTCMGCHRLMNPLGMPFEIYNHAGFVRRTDHGQPPDGSTTIVDTPDGALDGTVNDAVELAELLAESPYARRCFIRQVFRYFLGRDETLADACTLAAMEAAFADGSFFAMLDALVTSDTFLYRHVEGGAR